MNSFYNLPRELQTYIYEFDSTYHLKFKKVLKEITFLNAHRFFYYDRNGHISFQYITPDTIDIIFNERLTNMNDNYKRSLKEMLIDDYNNERFNILGENSDNLYLDIIHDKRYENDYNLQIPSFWFKNRMDSILTSF